MQIAFLQSDHVNMTCVFFPRFELAKWIFFNYTLDFSHIFKLKYLLIPISFVILILIVFMHIKYLI